MFALFASLWLRLAIGIIKISSCMVLGLISDNCTVALQPCLMALSNLSLIVALVISFSFRLALPLLPFQLIRYGRCLPPCICSITLLWRGHHRPPAQ